MQHRFHIRNHRQVLRHLCESEAVERGKTHFLAALGRELILRHSKRVLFRPTYSDPNSAHFFSAVHS